VLLPENTSLSGFSRSIGVGIEKAAHKVPPKLNFKRNSSLNPIACFDSIPLEDLRLGLSVAVCGLLLAGYIFLKTLLEYPVKYCKGFVYDVKCWVNTFLWAVIFIYCL